MASVKPYRRNACAVIIDAQRPGLVLCGERFDFPGSFQLPQGGIEPGEDPIDAALREACEELGLGADDLTPLGMAPQPIRYDFPTSPGIELAIAQRYRGQEQWWVALRLRPGASPRPTIVEHPEFRDCAWLRPTELLPLVVEFKRAAYAEGLAAMAPWIGTPHPHAKPGVAKN